MPEHDPNGRPAGRLRRWWDAQAPPFRRMLVAQAAHGGGDALVAVALANTLFFDVPIGEARDRVGLYLLVAMTPYALLSPIVGPLLDRWRDSYRIAVVVAAAGRAALAILMSSRTDRLVLYPMAFGVLVLSRAHAVSRAALVPSVCPAERPLLWTNARLALATLAGGALAIGPAIALAAISAWPVLWLAGLVFTAAAVMAFRLPQVARPARRQVAKGEHRVLPAHVLAAGFAGAALRGVVGFLTFFLAFALRAQGEGGGAFGAVLVAAGIGGIAGSLAAPLVRRLRGGTVLLAASLAAIGLTAVAIVPGFGVGTAALLGGVTALAAAVGRLGFDSLIQRDTPEQVRGRAFARYETIFQLTWVAGAGLATGVPLGTGPGLRTAAVICLVGVVGAVGARVRAAGGGG